MAYVKKLKRRGRNQERKALSQQEPVITPATTGAPIKPPANIGVYLQRFETQEPFCASDRIRGEWIVKNSDNMELFNPNKNYEIVIFHLPCRAIVKYGRIKILDICDKVWERNIPEFQELIEPIDAIIVPTQQLKAELIKVTNKPVHVISDGHDFSEYSSRLQNPHIHRAKEVVWFGYAENARPLEPFVNYIKSLGLKLKVICQHQNTSPLQHADVFVKWNVKTYVQEISKSDFAILPANQNYKSDNKDITALLCGIPVAKTKDDISRFMEPHERQLELHKHKKELVKYNVRERSEEYLKIITSIKKIDVVQVYSAICGRFDKPRQDIKVFGDHPADRFKMPVMNAKIYKILSHTYFSSQFTVYMDGNIFLNVPPLKLISELLGEADMALFRHPYRHCLYQEHEPAKQRILPPFKALMDEQVTRYREQGMPENFGLGECGMLIRRNNAVTAEFNDRWWAEICRYTNRDQMSFPYVLWKMKDRIKLKFILGNVRKHAYFKYINH